MKSSFQSVQFSGSYYILSSTTITAMGMSVFITADKPVTPVLYSPSVPATTSLLSVCSSGQPLFVVLALFPPHYFLHSST